MAETARTPLITDDDLDCLDTLKADNTMSASDLYVLAPRLRSRWVAEAFVELTLALQDRCDREDRKHSRERTEVWIDAAVITHDRAAEYRDGRP